jgi:peptidylamidoglycolate lyase
MVASVRLGANSSLELGRGDFRFRVLPGWGVLNDKTPVKNCHGIVLDREGHVILLTDHVANNVIVYNQAGKLVSKWGCSSQGRTDSPS